MAWLTVKCWTFGDLATFCLSFAVLAIYELPVKILTSAFNMPYTNSDILAIWVFQLIFFIRQAEVHHFYFATYWPKKCQTFRPNDDNFHQVWIWCYTFRYLVRLRHFCCWNVIRLCDFYLWPFDIGQWSYMVGDVINPSTKFEDPITICSWVMSYDVHWQCVCSHCACTVPRDLYI